MVPLVIAGIFGLLLAWPAHPAEWSLQFFHDEDDSSLFLADIACPSRTTCIAVGEIQGKKARPVTLVTTDGGNTWGLFDNREYGYATYFLDETVGWMVTEKGLWVTEELGKTWRKLGKLNGIARVYFKSRLRGWAIGDEKRVLETRDGGKTWTPVAAAATPKANPEYSTYGWIDFANYNSGMIVGWSRPPRREPGLFDRLGEDRPRRQWPSLTMLLQTSDAGETWKSASYSLFGRMTRFQRLPSGDGLVLMHFDDAFEWPCEIYRMDAQKGAAERVFRRKDRDVTDLAIAGRTAYLAAIERSGSLPNTPIPGKLRILRSTDWANWEEMQVDYRAFAGRARIGRSPDGALYVATDTGMVLRFQE